MKLQTQIHKLDADKKLVFGFASAADTVDSHGDIISADELERAAYDFVINSRAGHEMHNGKKIADLVESFFISADKAQLLGLTHHVGHWWIGFHINDDDVWDKIKNGTYSMFSIGGRARRIENE